MSKKISLIALKGSNECYRLSGRGSSLRRHAANSNIFVEVVVKCESLRKAYSVHDREAGTVNEAKRVIGIVTEDA